jgi:nucleoside diphosphate kinase
MADVNERTFIMIKPDGVHRGLVGDIVGRFEQRGYKLVALKMIQVRLQTLIYIIRNKRIFSSYRHLELYLKVIMKNTKVRNKRDSFFFNENLQFS